MWFLIKAAFWISLVLLLVPMPDNGSAQRQVSAIEAFGAAQAAIGDMKGFCERNPAACATGQAALTTIGEKAKVGAKLVHDYLDEKLPAEQAKPATEAHRPPPAAPAVTGSAHPRPQPKPAG